MNEIIASISSFPAIVPSIFLIVLLLLGLLALVGLFDAHHTGVDPHLEPGIDLHATDVHSLDADGFHDWMSALGVGRVPMYLIASAIVFPWWVLTMLGQMYLLPLIALVPNWIAGSVIALGALIAAFFIAIRIVRPFKPYFATQHSITRPTDLVGRPCKIITGSVSERFGQAEVKVDSGAPHVVQVFASGKNELVRGSQALILSFDATLKRYEVEAYDG